MMVRTCRINHSAMAQRQHQVACNLHADKIREQTTQSLKHFHSLPLSYLPLLHPLAKCRVRLDRSTFARQLKEIDIGRAVTFSLTTFAFISF